MKVSCPSCGTNYNIDDKRIPPGGAKLKCAKCQATFPIKRDAGGAAVPLPGGGAPSSNPAIPLPGSAVTGTIPAMGRNPAVPLPGSAGFDINVATNPAIPLPGNPADSGTRPAVGGGLTAAVPLPGGLAAAPDEEVTSAVPMPGAPPSSPSPWEGESTRVATIPMPRAALRPDARPSSNPSIPLPGSGTPTGKAVTMTLNAAVPTTPGTPFGGAARSPAGASAIPLPGAGGAPRASAIPLPGAGASAIPLPSAGASAIPLPGQSGPGDDLDFADADLVDAPPAAPAPRAPSISAAVPLPSGNDVDESTRVESGPAGDGVGIDFGDADFSEPAPASSAIPLPSGDGGGVPGEELTGAGGGFDFGELPPPPEPPASTGGGVDFGVDFGESPPAQQEAAPVDFGDLPSPAADAPPQGSPFDFSGPEDQTNTSIPLPGPGGEPSGGLDFDAPPPPPPAPSGGSQDDLLDFGELPSPAGASDLPAPAEAAPDFSFDISAPPPPAARAAPPPADPAPSFGEVDFGGGSQTTSVVDPLEFDPTSKSSPAAPRDALEADLSAPIPPPSSSGPADGLEMLTFIDDVAKQQGPAPAARPTSGKVIRWHVRRRSGKTFGPFDEGVVVKMLEDGQLLGNEDISPDGESWSPMSSAPALASAIQRLMDSPARAQGQASSDLALGDSTARPSGSQPASVERLNKLYEGRMAAVAVVDRRQSTEKFRRKLPLLIAAGVVFALGAAGGSLALTRYGPFGMRLWLPAKLAPTSPQHAEYLEAKKALLQDTFKSYQEARDITSKILSGTEYPEVRAVWCQAIFYLHRRYAAATPQERQEADAALPRVELLGMKNAEVVKAFAGKALATRAPAEALALLQEAKARAANEGDRELDLLMAEAYAIKNDPKAAEEVLTRVLQADKTSAKALHALGNLKQAANQADEAAKSYAAALEVDPNHAISGVELAAVDLLVRHNDEEALKAVERALSGDAQKLLGPAELARAKALRGVALAAQFKPKEATEELEASLKLDPDSVFTKAMLARVLLSQREHKRALPLYKEAATREPKNLEYTEGYLLSLIATGNMSGALTQVEQANARFPGNARIAFLYGRISEALDNAAEAEGHYKRAVAADAELYQANLALARFYLRFRRVPDAKPQLEEAAKKAPNDAAVHAGLGELLLAEANLADARKEFDTAVRLDPNLADSHLGLAKVELAESRFAESLKKADQALELDQRLKDARLQRSLALWKLARLDEAVEELGRAKEEDPKNARVLLTTGAVQLDKGNLPQAETALVAALTHEPSNHEAHFYLARVKARRREYTQAIESMKNALERSPKRAAYHYELGLIYRDATRLNEAIEAWNTTVKLDPLHADALEALGQAHLDRGELDRAVVAFDESLKADGSRTRILSLVGDCYFQAAKWPEAILRYQAALKKDPKLVQVYYKLGRAYSEKGEHAKAITFFQRATVVDGDNPMPYYYLGYGYKERGRKREAVAAFRDYLKRRPEAEDRKEIEDEIYDLEQDYQ